MWCGAGGWLNEIRISFAEQGELLNWTRRDFGVSGFG